MSARTPDITDAAAASLTAEALSSAAPTNAASRMEGAGVELQLVTALGVSERSSLSASLQDFALWMRKNIHKKECCFFDRDKR